MFNFINTSHLLWHGVTFVTVRQISTAQAKLGAVAVRLLLAIGGVAVILLMPLESRAHVVREAVIRSTLGTAAVAYYYDATDEMMFAEKATSMRNRHIKLASRAAPPLPALPWTNPPDCGNRRTINALAVGSDGRQAKIAAYYHYDHATNQPVLIAVEDLSGLSKRIIKLKCGTRDHHCVLAHPCNIPCPGKPCCCQ